MKNLGRYTTLDKVWDKYPNGGGEGDYVFIDDVKYLWDDINRTWGSTTVDPGGPGSGNIEGDLNVTGRATFEDDVTIGNFVAGSSGAKIYKNGDAEFRNLRVDSLLLIDPETGDYVHLSDFIINYVGTGGAGGSGLDWSSYEFKSPATGNRFVLYDPIAKQTYYTTIDSINEYINERIGSSTFSVIKENDTVPLTDNNVLSSLRVVKEIEQRAISKVKEDTANKLIKFREGIDVGVYSGGTLGGGGTFRMIDGLSHLEVDQLDVRLRATFNEIRVKRTEHIGGELMLTAAGLICNKVEETPTIYRCYFDTKENTIPNYFKAGDLAISKMFNGVSDTPPIHLLSFFWREVTGVGPDFIDLSKTNFAAGSIEPKKGDHIVQLGNLSDPERQNAQILSTVGPRAPSDIQYAGISGFTLEGKERNAIYGDGKGNKLYGKVTFLADNGDEGGIPGGFDGIRIDKIDVEYARGDSTTVAPTTGWITDAPPLAEGPYLWSRVKLTFMDGEVKYSEASFIEVRDGADAIAPIIIDDEWAFWDKAQGTFVKSGFPSIGDDGNAPRVGANGNWEEWDPTTNPPGYKDTGVKAEGEDGTGIDTIVEQYYISSIPTDLDGGTWQAAVPTPAKGVYIWTRTKITLTNGSVTTTIPLMATGFDGADGKGVSIKPSVATAGDLPLTGNEVGDARLTRDTGRLHVWSGTAPWDDAGPFQGPTGPTGMPGADAIAPIIIDDEWAFWNKAQGTFVKSGFSSIGDDGHAPRIAANGNWEEWDPTKIPPGYKDTGVKAQGPAGADGTDGIRGPAGADGVTTYTWVRYADTALGAGMSQYPIGKKYIGFAYNKTVKQESSIALDYDWSLIVGTDGQPGPKGADGVQLYFWLRYADTPTTGMSDDPTGKKYTGIAVNKITPKESSDYLDYSWQLTKGEDGMSPYIGVNGNWYVWDANRVPTPGYIDSGDAAIPDAGKAPRINGSGIWEVWDHVSEVWTSTGVTAQGPKGDKGATGTRGPEGASGVGISSIVEYYLISSVSTGVTTATAGWTTGFQQMTPAKKYLWNYERIYFTDGSNQPTIPVVIGVYGDTGNTGNTGQTGATGRSITGISERYLTSSASTAVTRSTPGWQTTMQLTTPAKRYLWNYEIITWNSAPITTYVEPIIIGVHGDSGDDGVDSISVVITKQGAFKVVWNQYDTNGDLLGFPESAVSVIGGVNINGVDYVQCKIVVRKGVTDITSSVFADPTFAPKWYVNNNHQSGQITPILNLRASIFANGVDDEVRFEYNDVNMINW